MRPIKLFVFFFSFVLSTAPLFSQSCSDLSVGPNASFNGFVLFPPTNAWNTDISNAPLDPNSATIAAAPGFAGLHLHPDFSSVAGGNYGIPYVVVDSHANPGVVPVEVGLYPGQSDVVVAPFSTTMPIEDTNPDCLGWPDTYEGDAHALVIDRATCWIYETYSTHRCKGAFHADAETIWDAQGNELRPGGWTSVDAAGLSVLAGLIRYDEVAAGSINHAIRFTMNMTRADNNGSYFVPPATHAAGSNWGSDNIMGMRIRLKASFDISGYSATNQIILKAMKKYGMILADNGGYFFFQGAPDPRWNDDDLSSLGAVGSENFEVVQMTPAFPGYDDSTYPTGANPTINSFTATASTVAAGTPVTLNWSTTNASYNFVDNAGPSRTGTITITPTTTTTYTLNATNQYGRSTQALTIHVTGSVPPPPTNACDINGDGIVNSTDVQATINQVLGITPCTTADLQQNNQCNASDMQRVVNAALGESCLVGL